MIQVKPTRWVHRHDLERDIYGRPDSAEIVERCWDYLMDEHPVASPDAPARAASEILAARLRASASRGPISSPSLEAKLAAQQATIDRLLAFVPVRAHAIPSDRLEKIARKISERAAELFGPSSVLVLPEADDDSSACYRIVVEADLGDDPETFARSSFALQKYVAESLPWDFESIRVFVEPR